MAQVLLMRQFDVFANPSARSKDAVPFVIVLQSDYVPTATAVVVASLVPDEGHGRAGRLYPAVEVLDRRLVIFVTDLATVPRAALTSPVANLEQERSRIIAALDLLFTGI